MHKNSDVAIYFANKGLSCFAGHSFYFLDYKADVCPDHIQQSKVEEEHFKGRDSYCPTHLLLCFGHAQGSYIVEGCGISGPCEDCPSRKRLLFSKMLVPLEPESRLGCVGTKGLEI